MDCQGLAINTYYACLENVHETASAVYECIIKTAVQEERIMNEATGNPRCDITVSGDGTWKKRGFTLLFGVATLIGKLTKKVLDTVVKSSFCQACNVQTKKKEDAIDEYNECNESHEEKCTINHEGIAGKMEITTDIRRRGR
ncbi:hypothetical protein WH47_03968 [Habropoda laboriosa]|uniref:Mutator-like transposase domain-containing protein n=1 Tax=Habropoda laboriosa TaxID=597456 RepID=A0A0L7QUB5_9HYME|nr:hypothetical protein WH47_03968 [Habropoda laboriosa]